MAGGRWPACLACAELAAAAPPDWHTGTGQRPGALACRRYDLSQFVPVEVRAGALVLLHGENVHYRCAGGGAQCLGPACATATARLPCCRLAGPSRDDGGRGESWPHCWPALIPAPAPAPAPARPCPPRSAENTSSESRHAYSMHLVESDAAHAWSPDNWAQRPADMPWEPLYDDTAAAQAG